MVSIRSENGSGLDLGALNPGELGQGDLDRGDLNRGELDRELSLGEGGESTRLPSARRPAVPLRNAMLSALLLVVPLAVHGQQAAPPATSTAQSAVALAAQQTSQPSSTPPGSQSPGSQPPGSQPPAGQSAAPQSATPQQDQPPEAGGPAGDNGAIAIPRKKENGDAATPPPPPAPAERKVVNPPGMDNYSIRVDVPVVNVDVNVLLQKNKEFVRGLKPENFRVLEDGVPQRITDVKVTQTPITAVMLLEFAANNYQFVYDMQTSSYYFFRQLRPDDYIAVMTYDMQTRIVSDFTKNKEVVAQALQSLMIPGFSETNIFDALYETLDRLSRIEGRKYIVLIGTGRDTFSKITLDTILAKVKATPNVTIFTISTGQFLLQMADAANMMGSITRMNYLQADNQMQTFARMTGGLHFAPIFEGQLPDVFHQINDAIRNEYIVTYRPTNTRTDGTYRKLKVELVDNEGQPLRMQDEKGKPLKYDIIARDGYRAKQTVE